MIFIMRKAALLIDCSVAQASAALKERILRLGKLRCILFCILYVSVPGLVHAEPRNLILISIDTLRADYLSCNGSREAQTPNLDQLAKQGVNFTRVRTPVPLTLPSHTSIMTAMYPQSHGVRENGIYALGKNHLTLAEVLKKHDYATAAFVGSFILDHRFGLAQGFDVYDDRTWSEASQMERPDTERNAGAVYKAFAKWFDNWQGKQPFFVWIHLYDPHAPYIPPAFYSKRYPENPYAGEVAYSDAVVGEILKKVALRKMLDNTIVAVVGDHGEGLGEHQENTHSVLIYNSTLHVPMMIRAPGLIPAGSKVNELCSTIDLAPSLLDYLGITEKLGQGTSLRNLVEKKKSTDEVFAYSESLYPKINLGWSELHGLEDAGYHFILAPKPELYDAKNDPAEKNNKIQQYPDIANRMKRKLDGLIAGSFEVSPASIDPETKEKLASLGYISGTPVPASRKSAGIDPKDKMAVWNEIQVGIGEYTSANFEDAAKTFQKILTREKDLLLVYDYLGSSYIQMEKWQDAEKVFRQALSHGIDWSGLHMKLGEIYLKRGELLLAQQELEKAIASDRLNVSAYYYLGNVFRTRREFSKAVEYYNRALEINPAYVYARNGLGMAYKAMKKDEEALLAFQAAVDVDPGGLPNYFNLAIQLERMNRYREALDNYRKFMALSANKGFPRERETAASAIRELETKLGDVQPE